jgi:hypothetical protein
VKNICEVDISFRFNPYSPIEKPKVLHVSGIWTDEGFAEIAIFHAGDDFSNEFEAAGLYPRAKELADIAFREWLAELATEREIDRCLDERHVALA